MADPMTQAYDMTRAVQEEALKNTQRWNNWVDAFVVNPADPPMGMTPKDVVWKRGKIQLYRYHAQTAQRHPIPYFIVPWLGISRPYVLDMLPGHSMIEFLVQHLNEALTQHACYQVQSSPLRKREPCLEDSELLISPRIGRKTSNENSARHYGVSGVILQNSGLIIPQSWYRWKRSGNS